MLRVVDGGVLWSLLHPSLFKALVFAVAVDGNPLVKKDIALERRPDAFSAAYVTGLW